VRRSIPGIRALRVSAAMAVALLGVSLVGRPPVVDAASGSTQAKETVRLINGVRAAAGKSALSIDVYLAKVATDGAIPCPDTDGTIAGRTKDFAAYGQMDHALRNCASSTYQVSSVMFVGQLRDKMGYSAASVGEIIGVNGGYGTGEYLFTYKTYSTNTYSTTGHMVAGWLKSSSHASIMLGNYNRVGCGAWWQTGSTIYYDCVFAIGGPAPSGLAAAPTKSPFGDPAPTAAPTRAPGSGGSGGSSGSGTTKPKATAAPTATPTSTPTATPTATPTPEPILDLPDPVLLSSEAATPLALAAGTMPGPPQAPGSGGLLTIASLGAMAVGILGLALIFLRRRFISPAQP